MTIKIPLHQGTTSPGGGNTIHSLASLRESQDNYNDNFHLNNMQQNIEFIKSECKCCNPTELGDYKVRNRTTGAACALWPLVLLPHGVLLQGLPLARSVAPGRCIFTISNLGQLFAKESVETWFCSPAVVRHRAACANVRNRTTGAACAPRPLALLPHGSQPHGPTVARSVAQGRCIFVVACFACLRRRTVAPVCANVRNQTTEAACAPRPLALEPLVLHGHWRNPICIGFRKLRR